MTNEDYKERDMEMFKYWLFLLCYSLALPHASARDAIDVETLNRHIFIGQAYPSGKVYVRRFVEESGTVSNWPTTINLLPIATGADLSAIGEARFVQVINDKIENSIQKSVNIPSVEGMNENHINCGLGEKTKPDPAHKYLSSDLFDTIFDHCESNASIAIYQIAPSNFSFMVLGTDSYLTLTAPQVIDKKKRPLSGTEKRLVEAAKADTIKSTAGYECTTNPAFLDSAQQIFAARLNGHATSLRLSNYLNPGCAGHLSSIYVLDILEGTKLLKSFTIYQYQGVL